jgi:hypothetical protein
VPDVGASPSGCTQDAGKPVSRKDEAEGFSTRLRIVAAAIFAALSSGMRQICETVWQYCLRIHQVCRIKVVLRELPSVVVKTEVARSMPLCKPLSPKRNGP